MLNIINSLLFLIILFPSCTSNLADESTNFTKEGLFPKGIEGPAVDSEGNLYAVNFQKEGTIGKINNKGEVSHFVSLPNGSIGNGIRFDQNDHMYIADYTNHNILLIKKGTKNIAIYANDTTMNQPNDVAIAPNGTLYASDPNWSESTGNLWMAKDNKLILLEKNMGTTNGVEVSPNGEKLYVNESIQKNVWVYDINNDGTISNKTLLKTFPDHGMDGMRCDAKGNLYITRFGKGTVVVLSPEGKTIREITLKGKKPTNLTFGGKDNKQCFVTIQDRGCIETFFIE